MKRFKLFLGDTDGVTSIEYALLGSLIAVAIVAGVSATGSSLLTLWTDVQVKVSAALTT